MYSFPRFLSLETFLFTPHYAKDFPSCNTIDLNLCCMYTGSHRFIYWLTYRNIYIHFFFFQRNSIIDCLKYALSPYAFVILITHFIVRLYNTSYSHPIYISAIMCCEKSKYTNHNYSHLVIINSPYSLCTVKIIWIKVMKIH